MKGGGRPYALDAPIRGSELRGAPAAHAARERRGSGRPAPSRQPRPRSAAAGSSGLQRVRALRHRRLLVGGLVGVDDALAGGLVELARSGWQRGQRRPRGRRRRRPRGSGGPPSSATTCTLLLRRRAASLVRIRLIWDLMFATKSLDDRLSDVIWIRGPRRAPEGPAPRTTPPGYQRRPKRPKFRRGRAARASPTAVRRPGADRDQLVPGVEVDAHAVRRWLTTSATGCRRPVVADDHRRAVVVEVHAGVHRRQVGELRPPRSDRRATGPASSARRSSRVGRRCGARRPPPASRPRRARC